MTKQHTPGPWRIHYERGTTQIRTADNKSIMCDAAYYPWVTENQSDWHLIAAAPELLVALEAAVEQLKGYGADGYASGSDAAIRKAKGETE